MILVPREGLVSVRKTESVRNYHYKKMGGKRESFETIRFMTEFLVKLSQGSVITTPIIYLGSKRDPYCWEGVWKHHRVYAGGRILHMSGYDVKCLIPAEDRLRE